MSLRIGNQPVPSHDLLEVALDCLEAHDAAGLALEVIAHPGQRRKLLATASAVDTMIQFLLVLYPKKIHVSVKAFSPPVPPFSV